MKIGDYVLAKFGPMQHPGQIIEVMDSKTFKVKLFMVDRRSYIMLINELTLISTEKAMLLKLENE
jgi:hydrogenase maturation factor